MTGTRYDICFATTKLAKFCNDPGKTHFEALIWLLGYLRQTSNIGIKYYNDDKNSPIGELLIRNNIPHGENNSFTFSDSSWQDDKDTGRSTESYAIINLGGLIDYSTFVPDPIAMPSGEAEYNASAVACMATLHNTFVDKEMRNLGTKTINKNDYMIPGGQDWNPSLILLDSTAAVSMALTAKSTSRTRHIDRRFHLVRNGQANNKHKLLWITKSDQVADIGTKSVTLVTLQPIMNVLFVAVQP